MQYDAMLAGRRALITGGSRDVGRATAELFLKHGARVALIDNDAAALEIQGAHGFRGNLGDEAQLTDLIGEARGALRGVDLLVNVAGASLTGDLADISDEDMVRALGEDFLRTVRSVKAVLGDMMENRRGEIVNITSDLASRSAPGTAAVAACAGAIAAFTRNVTMDYLRYHVRANCVLYPFDSRPERAPLTGAPVELDAAHAALWFACDLSRFTVGESIPVNGGLAYFAGQPLDGRCRA